MAENGGASYRIKSKRPASSHEEHEQITQATDPMEARLLRMKSKIQKVPGTEWMDEMMDKYGPGPS